MPLRRLLVVISVLLAGSAWAVTPGQRALLFGGVHPTFQIDLTQGTLPSQITLSRASNATYFDASGVLQTASTNVARFDHNQASPFAARGLFIEEQRTNIALWNRDLTNAAWTKTNVTAALDQTGIDGAANSASSILATAGNGTVLQAITLASSQRFQTAYVQRITGSGVVNMTTDGGATWTAITVPGAGTWGRVSIPAQTVTNPSVGFQIVTNGDKIKVDFVQNETGAFATSAIATTTVSVIRSADIALLAGNALALTQAGAASIVAEFGPGNGTSFSARIIGMDNPAFLFVNSVLTAAKIAAYNGAQIVSAANTFDLTNGTFRAGISFDASGRTIVSNGGAVVTDSNAIGTRAHVYLGNDSGTGNFLSGYIRKLAIYNQRIPNAALQARSVANAPF